MKILFDLSEYGIPAGTKLRIRRVMFTVMITWHGKRGKKRTEWPFIKSLN